MRLRRMLRKKVGEHQSRITGFSWAMWGTDELMTWGARIRITGSQSDAYLADMVCRFDKAYLLPCWPENWNVSFKLYTSRETQIEGQYKEGRLTFTRQGDMEVVEANKR